MSAKLRGITTFALVMLIAGSIDSIRNLPATALFGSAIIFFAVFAGIVFLIPAALVSAELSSAWTQKSGIFHWVQLAFGKRTGFLAVWLQWINTMVWFPTILSFIAGTLAFLIDPSLAENKLYLVTVILTTFWFLTILNLRGVKASAKFASICALVGMIIPMALIIGLALFWVLGHHPLQLHLTMDNLLPNLSHGQSWISLTAIMTAFLGMELATVHVRQVNQPQKTFPKALMYSVIIILITMVMGALAIAFVLPTDKINLVDGIMQAFSSFFTAYHMKWMIPVITVMIVIGSLGGMINWIISPAKGLHNAAQEGYLPEFFTKTNKYNVPYNILLAQAVLVTVICLAFLLMPSVNGSYWLLTDLSTQLYMLMYVLMFVAALFLRYKHAAQERPFIIPGGKAGMWVVAGLGLIGCCLTIAVGFIPPESIDIGSKMHFELMFVGGMLLMLSPLLVFYFKKPRVVKPAS